LELLADRLDASGAAHEAEQVKRYRSQVASLVARSADLVLRRAALAVAGLEGRVRAGTVDCRREPGNALPRGVAQLPARPGRHGALGSVAVAGFAAWAAAVRAGDHPDSDLIPAALAGQWEDVIDRTIAERAQFPERLIAFQRAGESRWHQDWSDAAAIITARWEISRQADWSIVRVPHLVAEWLCGPAREWRYGGPVIVDLGAVDPTGTGLGGRHAARLHSLSAT
jgi:hypothetical protein